MDKPRPVDALEGSNLKAISYWQGFITKWGIMNLRDIQEGIYEFFRLSIINDDGTNNTDIIDSIESDLLNRNIPFPQNLSQLSSNEIINYLTLRDKFYSEKLIILRELVDGHYPHITSSAQREMIFVHLEEEM